MDISFQGTYDRKIFLQGLKLIERTSWLKNVLRWASFALALYVVISGIYTWNAEGLTPSEGSTLFRHFIAFFLLAYYYISPYISRWNMTYRLYKNNTLRMMRGHANLEGIEIGSKGIFPWERFYRKGKKDNLLALLTLDGTVAIFHKGFFQTNGDWNRFNQLVEQKIIEPK